MWFQRALKPSLEKTLERGKSLLLLGPRQTGKTSLVKTLPYTRYINLMDLQIAQKYQSNPGAFLQEMYFLAASQKAIPLVIIDEIQKVPSLTDYCQLLIDEKKIQFLLTGSSARKIQNLLPGRVIKKILSNLNSLEVDYTSFGLGGLLCNGSLPGILSLSDPSHIDEELGSYVALYLEEEIRKEALVRNLSAFQHFLRLACIESGRLINLSKISQDIGLSHNTISEYYRILQDCMLVKRLDPFVAPSSKSRRLTKAPKYLIFDLGIRRIGAREGANPSLEHQGHLFEQFVGLELFALIETLYPAALLSYWRDHDGPEVDYVLTYQNHSIPIEVKLSKNPSPKDCKHLKLFQQEYQQTGPAYVIAAIDQPRLLEEGISALPWHKIAQIFERAPFV